jgi:hypothetical protein
LKRSIYLNVPVQGVSTIQAGWQLGLQPSSAQNKVPKGANASDLHTILRWMPSCKRDFQLKAMPGFNLRCGIPIDKKAPITAPILVPEM